MAEWINAKDRLPEKDGLYLVMLDMDWETFVGKTKITEVTEFLVDPLKAISDGRYYFSEENKPCFLDPFPDDDNYSWNRVEPLDLDYVLYWMPLPEPPKELQ